MGDVAIRKIRELLIIDLFESFLDPEDTREKIRNVLEEAIGSKPKGIVINFEQVEWFSLGQYGPFGEVLSASRIAAINDIRIKLLVPEVSRECKRIRMGLRITHFDSFFEVFLYEADAIRSFYGESDPRRHLALALLRKPSGDIGVQVLDKGGLANVAETADMRPALHGIWLPNSGVFPSNELTRFESLINQDPPVPEAKLQKFLEAHPHWLYILGEQYDRALSQVQLPPLEFRPTMALIKRPVDYKTMIPDFLVKRIGLELWDVIDIKRTGVPVVVSGDLRRHFSSHVTNAVAQLREYSRRLRMPETQDYLYNRYNLTISEPMAMVVIGRDFCFSSDVEKDIFRAQDGVRVYTYDDLYRLAKSRAIK